MTNGKGNRHRSMNQSEAVARRNKNDWAKSTPQQIKTTLAINRLPWLKALVRVIIQANRTRRTKARVFGTQLNQFRKCSASQNMNLA